MAPVDEEEPEPEPLSLAEPEEPPPLVLEARGEEEVAVPRAVVEVVRVVPHWKASGWVILG